MEIMTRHAPSGWVLYRLGQLFAERREKVSDKDFQPLSVTMNGIVPQLDSAAKSDDGDNRKLVRAGDYVINSRSDRKGSGGVSPLDGSVSLISIVLEPLRIHPPFAHHLLRSPAFQEEFYRWGHGIVADLWTTRYSDMKNIRLYLPDLATQKQIADFLDAETVRIDALIEKKQRLIDATEAEFLERITHAVTGSAYEASLQPSGYAWHPTLPSTWSVVRLKFLCLKIVDCLHETPVHDEDGEYPSVRTADVKRGKLMVQNAKRVSSAEYQNRIQRLAPEPGDIVYTREGERFGLAALVPEGEKLCLGQRMMMFRANKRVLPAYLMWSLNGAFAYNYLKQGTAGATSPHLNIFDIRNVPIFLPPRHVQASICAELDARFAVKEKMIALVEKTIDGLSEYRAALITAAVTGQIDVAARARPMKTVPRHAGAYVVQLHANPQPKSLPDRRTVRVLVAAEVVHRLGVDPYLGRIKLQKLMFLAEAHANINEIDGCYERYRAGPYDGAMMTEIETGLRQEQFYAATEDAMSDRRRITFQRMPRAGDHRDALSATLGDRVASLRSMVDLFKDMNTEATEAVATLYAVWNDALIDGQQLDDAAIIRGFLQEWHKDKDKFRQSDLQHWLGWMHRKGIVPCGAGPRTISTSTPSLFEGE